MLKKKNTFLHLINILHLSSVISEVCFLLCGSCSELLLLHTTQLRTRHSFCPVTIISAVFFPVSVSENIFLLTSRLLPCVCVWGEEHQLILGRTKCDHLGQKQGQIETWCVLSVQAFCPWSSDWESFSGRSEKCC